MDEQNQIFKSIKKPEPLKGLTIKEAQQTLNESIARIKHQQDYEKYRKEQLNETKALRANK